ncbi:unnamed protein product [Paramecium sonneborni]|uniref:Uncharacterized protein n=1 Tax=Paramecium sonneborni TaxID=65129 RepID=A0A8S1RLT0_9CILI|nr:unnamed protein product [Paramecium sonneborni]
MEQKQQQLFNNVIEFIRLENKMNFYNMIKQFEFNFYQQLQYWSKYL